MISLSHVGNVRPDDIEMVWRRASQENAVNTNTKSGDTSESGPLFALYSKVVEEDDNKRAKRQQKDAEGIVLFTGLFSAALAVLLTESIKDLRPVPGTQDDSKFSPPRYAIWVNSLWSSSLAISLTSALLATLLQQWTRRYIRITQPLSSPHRRARIREFFFSSTDNLHFQLATDGVPTLLHLSVFLFFAGLLIQLRHIDHTVFNAVVPWVAICVVVYLGITLLPIFRPASPHYSPLPSLAWQFCTYLYLLFIPRLLPRKNIHNAEFRHPSRLLNRVESKADGKVSKNLPEFDARILDSLINNLGEDGVQEKFFEAIPGFFHSKLAEDSRLENIKKHLPSEFFDKFRRSVDQFLDETLSSDSVSELTRSRRLLSCLNATHILLGERAGMSIIFQIINNDNWTDVPPSPEIGRILKRWRNSTSSDDSLKVITGSCIIARIIAGVTKRNDTWKALARSHLEVTGRDLDYLKKGDNVLMANLIKTTRLFFEHKLNFLGILRPISEFRVEGILPKLRQEFCTLRNEIVERSSPGSESSDVFTFILEEIRPVYDALYPAASPQDTAPSSTAANGDSGHHGPSDQTMSAAPNTPPPPQLD